MSAEQYSGKSTVQEFRANSGEVGKVYGSYRSLPSDVTGLPVATEKSPLMANKSPR